MRCQNVQRRNLDCAHKDNGRYNSSVTGPAMISEGMPSVLRSPQKPAGNAIVEHCELVGEKLRETTFANGLTTRRFICPLYRPTYAPGLP
jgi:hypothetical protein